jgi:hypothetical protein
MFMLHGHQATKFLKSTAAFSVILLLFSLPSFAQLPNAAFWRHRVLSLGFTTTPQSILASLCSGVVTVQTKNAAGTATNVGSNLTVNLSGPGTMTFYSDSSCTVAVSTVTVTTGTSSKSFYFVDSATGDLRPDFSTT